MSGTWQARSRPVFQAAVAAGSLVVGLVFLTTLPELAGSGDRAAVRGLGVLLVVVGAGGLLTLGRQRIEVDPGTRRVVVDSSVLGERTRVIRFDEVQEVRLEWTGTPSNGVVFYYLALRLRDGSRQTLFSPGRFYPGCGDRGTVDSWRRQLQEALGTGRGA